MSNDREPDLELPLLVAWNPLAAGACAAMAEHDFVQPERPRAVAICGIYVLATLARVLKRDMTARP